MKLVTLEVLFLIFFAAICVDFISGILVAAKNGKLKSRSCSNGMFRSIGECIVLFIFIFVSKLIPDLELIFSTFVVGFIFKEGLSIAENLTLLGVWIPNSVKKTLEVGVKQIDNKDITEVKEDKKC